MNGGSEVAGGSLLTVGDPHRLGVGIPWDRPELWTVDWLFEISKEYDVQRTKSIAILGIRSSGMIYSTENRTNGIPRICVEHRNLIEQEDR